jgi:GNAT superfamily N-acetyltransferase
MHLASPNLDYLGNHQRFLPVLAEAMFSHWRSVLKAQGKSREDFGKSMQARCRIGSLPTAVVAFEGDSVLGAAALKPEDLEIRSHLTPWLGGVFVLPEHRGRGVASALVTRLVTEAKDLGLNELYLWTPSSESLYARHGWKVFERVSYHGLEICIMHRRLAS